MYEGRLMKNTAGPNLPPPTPNLGNAPVQRRTITQELDEQKTLIGDLFGVVQQFEVALQPVMDPNHREQGGSASTAPPESPMPLDRIGVHNVALHSAIQTLRSLLERLHL